MTDSVEMVERDQLLARVREEMGRAAERRIALLIFRSYAEHGFPCDTRDHEIGEIALKVIEYIDELERDLDRYQKWHLGDSC